MKGKLIVIEGVSDGVGKTTQLKALFDNLNRDGYDVITHHFPTYESISGSFALAYLKGDFGKRDNINPYAISSFYAIDRYFVYRDKLSKALNDGKIVLLDRYTTSNLIYQTCLFSDSKKDEFIDYISDYEYNRLGLKRPDLVIFLKLSKDVANSLRQKRTFNNGVMNDINEVDGNFLDSVYDNSLEVASKLGFEVINCDDGKNIRSVQDISSEIYKIVNEKLL